MSDAGWAVFAVCATALVVFLRWLWREGDEKGLDPLAESMKLTVGCITDLERRVRELEMAYVTQRRPKKKHSRKARSR